MFTKKKPEIGDLKFLNSAKTKKFAVVYSEWTSEIVNRLLDGVYDFFEKINIPKNKIFNSNVPGSFEIVHEVSKLQNKKKYDVIIAVGSIIKGETSHDKYIAQSVFNAISKLNCRNLCPIILCLLTDDNYKQALERSGGNQGNKGYDCALAAAKMSII